VRLDQRPVRRVVASDAAPTSYDEWPASIPAVGRLLRDGWELPAGVTLLVGENGSGKSTLLKLLAGVETPTAGTVVRARNLTIGYLTQEVGRDRAAKTVYEAVAAAAPHTLEPWEVEYRVAEILDGLGMKPDRLEQPVGTLSGGEKKMVGLAGLLLQAPDLLLLDEPDNHLDLAAKAWLEELVQGYRGAVVVVSHDRYLLDRIANRIVEVEDCRLEEYAGSYASYAEERERRLLRRHELHKVERDEIKRLEASLRELKRWASMNDKFAPRAESMARRVERARTAAAERPILRRERIRVRFDAARSGQNVLECKQATRSVGERVLFRPFDLVVRYGERVGVVGPNGSGKTTLLRAITGQEPLDGGSLNIGASVVLGYYAQEQETLPADQTPLQFVSALRPMSQQQAVGVLQRLLFSYEDAFTPIAKLSGGEKGRLQIARLMLADANFLVLDEPTNNLDIPSIEVLEAALDEFDGTVLVVSHDRYFLDRVVDRIVSIEDGEVRAYPGNYSDYLRRARR
jgi:ATP-binding cassette subfamily F protein 3